MTAGRIPLNSLLLKRSADNRHGLVYAPQRTVASQSDIPGIFHYGVPSSLSDPWRSAAGGVGFDEEVSLLAAAGEAVERAVGSLAQVPLKGRAGLKDEEVIEAEQFSLYTERQRNDPAFPFGFLYKEDCLYTNVYDLVTNDQYWVPQPLVVLRDDFATGVPTSSGLAAGPSPEYALLRAAQEVIERDALMTTWLHSIEARSIEVPAGFKQQVDALHGEIYVFDVTPKYSPFPVAIVAGGIPKGGVWRYSLGVACRENWEAAAGKAYLEWSQGIMFSGVYPKYVDVAEVAGKPYELVNSFDEHAVYYTVNPDKWYEIPMFKKRNETHNPLKYPPGGRTPRASLKLLQQSLKKSGVRMFYRDLTTIDSCQAGVRVVRVISPDLAPIFSHQAWPFLGGSVKDVNKRYNVRFDPEKFPNPMPHPLG